MNPDPAPPERRRSLHDASTRLLSSLMVAAGVLILVRTIVAGGGPLTVGVLFGLLFIAAGVARLHLLRRGSGG